MEGAGFDGGADLIDGADDDAFVVDGGEDWCEDFFGAEEVGEVGPGEVLASVAIAVLIYWGEVCAVLGVLNVDSALVRV